MAGSWDDFVAEHEGPELDAAREALRGDDDPPAGVREPRVPSPDRPAGYAIHRDALDDPGEVAQTATRTTLNADSNSKGLDEFGDIGNGRAPNSEAEKLRPEPERQQGLREGAEGTRRYEPLSQWPDQPI